MADEDFIRGANVAFEPQQEEGPDPSWEDDDINFWEELEELEEDDFDEETIEDSFNSWDKHYSEVTKEIFESI